MKKQKKQYDLSVDKSVSKVSPRSASQNQDNDSTVYYLGFFSQLGTGIALPIVFGGFIGHYADGVWGTKPKAVLAGLAIGFVLSLMYFVRTIVEFIKFNSQQ